MIKYLLAIVGLLALVACSSSEDEVSTSSGESSMGITIQSPQRVSLAVPDTDLSVKVTIDGQLYNLDRGINGSSWVGNFTLPENRPLSLTVEWFFDFLLLARYEDTLEPISEPVRLEVNESQYLTTGVEFDADGDGASNIAELEIGTNPTSAQNIDIVIPKLRPNESIGINGATGLTWDFHITYDWKNELPKIDNLMIDRNALREDGKAEFYWQAAHDEEFLYVIVFGESEDIATPIRDSRVATRDDAVRLFFDGDNSKLNYYDGLNDLYITIPLLAKRRPAEGALEPVVSEDGDYIFIFSPEKLIAVGDPAAPTFVELARIELNSKDLENTEWELGPEGQVPPISLNGFEFANGLASAGKQVYEIKLPLASLGIQVGRPFGFEVQIDSDHNGGDSDARYGWRHPSRNSNGPDVNNTVREPGFMGTVVLAQ